LAVGEGVVMVVAFAPDRIEDTSFGLALVVSDGQIWPWTPRSLW
jgi:hypothetical protein